MFSSYYEAVAVLGFSIFYVGSFYGLHVIRNAFKNTAKPFMICFIILSIIYMCMHVHSPATYAGYVLIYFVNVLDVLHTSTCKGVNDYLCFLVYSSSLILHTVWCAIPKNISYELTMHGNRYYDWLILFLWFPFYIFSPIYCRDSSSLSLYRDSSSLSLYWPAIFDIIDGIHMTEEQLDSARNPVWMQTVICLAVLMCYIPSLYEIYHLRFPELTTRSVKLSKRRVKLVQLFSSIVFLVLRFVLWIREVGNEDPAEVMKSAIRLYGHYKMWLKLRRRRRIVSVEARQLSADEASYFAEEKRSYLALCELIARLMQTFKSQHKQTMPKSV